MNRGELDLLLKPFPRNVVGVKVQSFSKDKKWASLVLYLQHTDVYGRLEEVDPHWSCEVVEVSRGPDNCEVRMKMTIGCVTRENSGEGFDQKSAISDALKRCAMLFGVGRYLYDSEVVWVPYNEEKDRYRTWTLADYEKHTKTKDERIEANDNNSSQLGAAPTTSRGVTFSDRAGVNARVLTAYHKYIAKYPAVNMETVLRDRYGKDKTTALDIPQLQDLAMFLEKLEGGVTNAVRQ